MTGTKKPHRAKVLCLEIKKLCEDEIAEANGHLKNCEEYRDGAMFQEESDEIIRIETEKEVYTRILTMIDKIYKYEKKDEFKPSYIQRLMFKWGISKMVSKCGK